MLQHRKGCEWHDAAIIPDAYCTSLWDATIWPQAYSRTKPGFIGLKLGENSSDRNFFTHGLAYTEYRPQPYWKPWDVLRETFKKTPATIFMQLCCRSMTLP